MSDIGIWKLSNNQPERLAPAEVSLEKALEGWIEKDPSLVQEGLSIVGRQLLLPKGRLDLLGIDPFGAIAVVEIKRSTIHRNTVVQALDYAAYLNACNSDELAQMMENYLAKQGSSLKDIIRRHNLDDDFLQDREIKIFIVGTGQDDDLKHVTELVKLDVFVIELGAFENDYGEYFITRQLTELDTQRTFESAEAAVKGQQSEVKRLFAIAHQNGIGEAFRIVYEAALDCNLYPRFYKHSIMYAPPANKTRCLMYAPVKPVNGRFALYVEVRAFAEFYPLRQRNIRRQLGWSGYAITTQEAKEFAERLRALFEAIP